ncbi:50S ribosomal protein L16 [archaeon]|jgi:large subunit ribosomal protein L10e|nr:50S ribosomal protein L16 [archaeon]MBT4373498.1 50S ribosomal protein L16 [archaeon]MBT4531946.1 50S ribosomal protein L16 [archaeon]MBT7001613.1 50S ribosomal protein L16 [archaeon]MBT7282495.1 50S ribosomal protein L16 [archaeon]
MASLRKANAYSKRKVTPFTRTSKRKNRAYIKVIPPQKIVKFVMGKFALIEKGKLPHKLIMASTEKCQIRHNALEACRQFINKKLDKNLSGMYAFKVVPFPHHIQRENKMITGAGADRMQTGMQLSFGKSMGKAAIMKVGAPIFEIHLPNEKAIQMARKTLKQVNSKLPCKSNIVYEKLN